AEIRPPGLAGPVAAAPALRQEPWGPARPPVCRLSRSCRPQRQLSQQAGPCAPSAQGAERRQEEAPPRRRRTGRQFSTASLRSAPRVVRAVIYHAKVTPTRPPTSPWLTPTPREPFRVALSVMRNATPPASAVSPR